ncbi:hypothetical protein JZ751_027192 [Albula glossodonta]|uniref:Uncharacterized protein n=1 Tax=Albula glossodonta TaxID=121402 RepID=A0A8T2NCJ8_9TELE|nr:hypothetical protein JZ751_027192 [Albula glossodonta]
MPTWVTWHIVPLPSFSVRMKSASFGGAKLEAIPYVTSTFRQGCCEAPMRALSPCFLVFIHLRDEGRPRFPLALAKTVGI